MKTYHLLLILLLVNISAFGQKNFTLSGKIVDEKGKPIDVVTVFLDGTNRGTSTNEQGGYTFNNLVPGIYRIVASRIGYEPEKKELIIADESIIMDLSLKSNVSQLKEVVISSSSTNPNISMFRKHFLGNTPNGTSCEIENPNVIFFEDDRLNIKAKSKNFIIINNRNLGYRIKYLLKSFNYSKTSTVTSFDGQCQFEEMTGTEEEQQTWKANRDSAYYGSLMHFLRAVYANKIHHQGFYTFLVKAQKGGIDLPRTPTDISSLITKMDSNFVDLKFQDILYVKYQPELKGSPSFSEEEYKRLLSGGSLVRLVADSAKIDSRGDYVDVKTFLIQLNWGGKRIGDRLPFEYEPN